MDAFYSCSYSHYFYYYYYYYFYDYSCSSCSYYCYYYSGERTCANAAASAQVSGMRRHSFAKRPLPTRVDLVGGDTGRARTGGPGISGTGRVNPQRQPPGARSTPSTHLRDRATEARSSHAPAPLQTAGAPLAAASPRRSCASARGGWGSPPPSLTLPSAP